MNNTDSFPNEFTLLFKNVQFFETWLLLSGTAKDVLLYCLINCQFTNVIPFRQKEIAIALNKKPNTISEAWRELLFHHLIVVRYVRKRKGAVYMLTKDYFWKGRGVDYLHTDNTGIRHEAKFQTYNSPVSQKTPSHLTERQLSLMKECGFEEDDLADFPLEDEVTHSQVVTSPASLAIMLPPDAEPTTDFDNVELDVDDVIAAREQATNTVVSTKVVSTETEASVSFKEACFYIFTLMNNAEDLFDFQEAFRNYVTSSPWKTKLANKFKSRFETTCANLKEVQKDKEREAEKKRLAQLSPPVFKIGKRENAQRLPVPRGTTKKRDCCSKRSFTSFY